MRLWRIRPPVQVQFLACGAEHTMAALAGGGVLAWGRNDRGQVRVRRRRGHECNTDVN